MQVQTRDARFFGETRLRYPLHRYERLARLMHARRAVKSSREVEVIRHACDISRDAFLRVARFVAAGVNEAEVETEFAYEFIRRRATFV